MNVGKSTRVALAMSGMKQKELAALLGISPQNLSATLAKENSHTETIRRLASALKMKCSDFIRLGEVDE